MIAEKTKTQAVVCPRCQASIEGKVLVCPLCSSFIHADKLGELTRQAAEAETKGQWSEALGLWREALHLVPGGTEQYVFLEGKVRELSGKVDRGATGPAGSAQPQAAWKKALGGAGGVALVLWKLKGLLFALLGKWKLLFFGLSKLSTLSSMLVSLGLYAPQMGWKFAAGFILSIYVHEIGHVHAARKFGLKASAPMFIPFLGAFIALKQHPLTKEEDARISMAGPMWGFWGAAVTYLLYFATRLPVFAAVGHSAAAINLFNLLPLAPLDGSGAFRAMSRSLRMACVAVLAGLWSVTGQGLLLVLMGFAVWQCFRKKAPPLGDQRAMVEYLALAAGLSLMFLLPRR